MNSLYKDVSEQVDLASEGRGYAVRMCDLHEVKVIERKTERHNNKTHRYINDNNANKDQTT